MDSTGVRFSYGAQPHPRDRSAECLCSAARRIALTCLALTWANPHVYLDTVMLVGSISAQYAPYAWTSGAGAAAASLLFFSLLGYGARQLVPVFAGARSWVILEVLVGATMWLIAAALILE